MYKGIVKVYRENDPEPQSRSFVEALEGRGKVTGGMLLEVVVTAKSTESLIRKINAVMETLDDE